MLKILKTNQEARDSLLRGLNKVADSVVSTLGPSGRNAVIGRPYQDPLITNDGETVAKNINLEDEIEELGGSIIKAATRKTNEKAGDGTTTTTCLLQSLANEAFKKAGNILEQKNPMDIKREIDRECARAVQLLAGKSKKIKTKEELKHIASISMENEEIGSVIAEVLNKVGKDGAVKTEQSLEFTTSYSFEDGSKFNHGFIVPSMENNNKGQAELESPLILYTNNKINSLSQLRTVLGVVSPLSKSLVIFTEQIEIEVVKKLLELRLESGFQTVVVKIPSSKQETFEDLVSLCGGKMIDETKDIKLENVVEDFLGKAKKVIISKDETIIIKGNGDVKKAVQDLKEKKDKAESLYDKELLTKRIGNLGGVIGTIKVGATTDSEREYLNLKVEDAVNATRCALEEGYVKGGGIALYEIANEMKDSILYNTLRAPYLKIVENAGGKIEIPDTVIDSTKVMRVALENACSYAGLLITTEVAIADKLEKPKDLTIDD